MKHLACLLCAVSVSLAAAATQDFSFTASAYDVGEALSQKGTAGATWSLGGVVATNVVCGGRNAMDLSFGGASDELSLVSDGALASNAVRTIAFGVSVDEMCAEPPGPFSGAAAISPAKFDGDAVVFYGWGDGAWRELLGAGLAANGFWDCRILLKTVGGRRYVSYKVSADGGVSWTTLKTRSGKTWFATVHEQARTKVAICGNSRLASIDTISASAQEPTATFRWVGGEAGAWSDSNNWRVVQDASHPASRAPGTAGDVALVEGDVTIDGVPTRDLVVEYDADGVATAVGGKILGTVTLDTDRPRAGKTLTATVPTLFGRSSDYEYKWYRGSYLKDYALHSSGTTLTPAASDYEHWYKFVALEDGATPAQTVEFYFSKLPVCYLTTDDGEDPSTQKEEHAGTIRMQGGENWKAMKFGKKQKDTYGVMSVKLRGNSTLYYPKKAYKVKLDKKADLFGMGENKHWVLLANYNDMANQRNKLAYDLANDIGSLGMNSEWVVCMFNGEYKGVYQFGEHIRIDENRVNIRDWEAIAEDGGGEAEDLSPISPDDYDITGSYLMEFSNEGDEVTTWTTKSGKLQMMTMANKPEYLNTNSDMYDFVRNFMQEYWDACTAANRKNPTTGKSYADYGDLDSMALYTLVNELFTNYDACKKSRYAYIDDPDRGGKLIWGPVWDFDWGSNSVRVKDDYDQWVTCGQSHKGTQSVAKQYSMFKEWFSDSDFCRRIYRLYWKHRARFGRIVADGGDLDANEAYLREAALADDAKWWSDRKGWNRTAAQDTAILKDHLARRLAWLDAQFASPKSVHDSVENFARSIQSAPCDYKPLGTIWSIR